MRRISFAIICTIAVLVLLFSYHTSTSGPAAVVAASPGSAGSDKAHVVSGTTAVTTSGPPTPASTGAASATPTTSVAAQITRPSTSTASSATHPSSTAAATTAKTTAASPVVVDGDAEMTRYGAVQVEVTISGGKITAVQAIQYPNSEQRDQEINSQAIPQLESQVISAQSAQVDGVSGATYTTQGYLSSLQSALDAANFK